MSMGVQIIMDRSGDTRHEFNEADAASVALAEERFRKLTGKGFRAVALAPNGDGGSVVNKFDPSVDRTLFIPQLIGG
jgi:hypothetical protein